MTNANEKAADVNQLRETSGQFGHGFEAMCRCGRTKGEHTAARPFTADEGDLPICEGFKKAKAPRK